MLVPLVLGIVASRRDLSTSTLAPAPLAPLAPSTRAPLSRLAPEHLLRRHSHPVRELLDVGGDDLRARLEALADLDAIAEAIAEHDLAAGELAVLHDEDPVGAVAALDGGHRDGDGALDAVGGDLHVRERPGLQLAVGIRHFSLDREGPRLEVHARRDADDLAGEHLLRKGVDLDRHVAPVLDPRRELLGHLGGELQRLQPHDPHHRRLRLDELPWRDQPLRDVAVERRADHRVAQLALRQAQRRGLRLDVGAQLPRRGERLVACRLRRVVPRLRDLEIGLRQQVPRGEVLRPIELLLRGVELRLGADHGRHCVERRQLAVGGGAVAGARLFERRALAVGAVLQLLGIELDERRPRRDAIAEIVDEARHAAGDLGADDHLFPRGERPDDVHLAAHVTHLRGLELDGAGLRPFGGLRGAIPGASRHAQQQRERPSGDGPFHRQGTSIMVVLTPMWIVRIALNRPYTFVVMALAILFVGPLAIVRTPTDIFPNINIPVVTVVWVYGGLSAEELGQRIVSGFERGMTTTVNDIEHIESQTLRGTSIVKVFFQPGARTEVAVAQISSISQSALRNMPAGTNPPFIITYNASTVPILQLGLSGNGLSEQQLYDLAVNFIRVQLATVQGASIPNPYGGKQAQIQVDLDPRALQAKGLVPTDVVNAIALQNLILPGGTSKIGGYEYDVRLHGSPDTVDELNDLPIRTSGTPIYIRDVAHVRNGFPPQTNIVRVNGQRAAMLSIIQSGSASTLDIVDRVKTALPRIATSLPPELQIKQLADQSVFVRASIQGVIREAVVAACLTAIMILVFLGSWRSTIIIAVSIPLSILTSIIVLSALGETINIMTLGGLALAVGILVDDATVAIENINTHLEDGKDLEPAILDGAHQIAIPAFVSTICICIVFVPMFFLTGVARYLFVPMAEAVVFAMLASYVLSRTLVPTMAKYLLRAHLPHGHPVSASLFARTQGALDA